MALNKAQTIAELKTGKPLLETVGIRYGSIYSVGDERVNGNVFNGLRNRGQIKEVKRDYSNGSLRSVVYEWTGPIDQSLSNEAQEAEAIAIEIEQLVEETVSEPIKSTKSIDYVTVTVVQKASDLIVNEAPDADAVERLRTNLIAKSTDVRLANGWSYEVEVALHDAIDDLLHQIMNEAQSKLEADEEAGS